MNVQKKPVIDLSTKIIVCLLALACAFCFTAMALYGQNTNPQQNFNAQVQLAAPSLWLNYNDATASFADSVSGLSFGNTAIGAPTAIGSMPTPNASYSTGSVGIKNVAIAHTGNLTNLQIRCYATCTTGQTITILILSGSGTSYTIVNSSIVLTLASNTSVQTFSAPANFTAVPVTAGQYLGFYVPSGTGVGKINSGPGFYYLATGSVPVGAQTYTFYSGNDFSLNGSVSITYTSGTPSLQQPGFDNTNPANYSAAFPYNGFAIAPNNTLGVIDWMNPWTMLLHIDRLNWNRTGTMVLASKGDIGSTANSWWELYLVANGTPGLSTLCFGRNGPIAIGGIGDVGNHNCTNVDTGNGYNEDIVVTDSGAGTGAALNLYVNGTGSGVLPQFAATTSFQYGFGAVNLTISGGTGYAASTAFTSSGGGANCTVSGAIPATGGVPTAGILPPGAFNNYNAGCTSLPTITLTSPTGVGISVVPSLTGASMNSTTFPVMAPGNISGGAYNGIDQSDSTQTSTNVDEFAIWNRALTPTEIYNIFYQTKFYQAILPAVPAHIPVILNEIVCADYDSTTTVSVAIKLHQLGYINLLGLAIEGDGGLGAAIFRQMLDQAGLNHVPMSMASNSSTFYPMSDTSFCTHANVATYNASTPVTYTAYPTTSQMYRRIFAANPTTAITLLTPTTLFGTYDFMNSAADGISALTGAQLWLQNVTNGGSLYLQGGPFCASGTLPITSPCSGSVTGDNSLEYPTQGQYVLNNLQGIPTYLMSGSPDANGLGVLYTRTSTDPLYLASATIATDSRTAWDSLGTMAILTPLFSGSVQIAYSGGTGYANYTQITSTGGGANCHVDAWLTASGGVPNGITTSFGKNYASVQWYNVYGHGCTSVPALNLVSPTGTGATLTAYLSAVCGTDTITQPSGVWTDSFSSTTCSNQYTVPFPWQAMMLNSGGGSPIYRWLLNSLENPVPIGQPRAQ